MTETVKREVIVSNIVRNFETAKKAVMVNNKVLYVLYHNPELRRFQYRAEIIDIGRKILLEAKYDEERDRVIVRYYAIDEKEVKSYITAIAKEIKHVNVVKRIRFSFTTSKTSKISIEITFDSGRLKSVGIRKDHKKSE